MDLLSKTNQNEQFSADNLKEQVQLITHISKKLHLKCDTILNEVSNIKEMLTSLDSVLYWFNENIHSNKNNNQCNPNVQINQQERTICQQEINLLKDDQMKKNEPNVSPIDRLKEEDINEMSVSRIDHIINYLYEQVQQSQLAHLDIKDILQDDQHFPLYHNLNDIPDFTANPKDIEICKEEEEEEESDEEELSMKTAPEYQRTVSSSLSIEDNIEDISLDNDAHHNKENIDHSDSNVNSKFSSVQFDISRDEDDNKRIDIRFRDPLDGRPINERIILKRVQTNGDQSIKKIKNHFDDYGDDGQDEHYLINNCGNKPRCPSFDCDTSIEEPKYDWAAMKNLWERRSLGPHRRGPKKMKK